MSNVKMYASGPGLFTCGKVALKLFFFAQLVLPFCRVSIVLLWDSDEKSYKWKVGFSRWRNRKKLDNIWSHFFCACDGKRPKKEGELKEKLFECRGPRNT